MTDGFSVSNSSFDYLYIDKKFKKICAYTFFKFYVKVPVRTFLRSENGHLPRFDLELAHLLAIEVLHVSIECGV